VSSIATTPTLATRRFGVRDELVEVGAGRGQFGHVDHDESLGHRHGLRVDDAHRQLSRPAPSKPSDRGLVRGREQRREREHDDAVAAVGLRSFVRGLEGAGRRRRGLGQRLARLALRPELLGGEVDAIGELLVAEADAQRDDVDVEATRDLFGNVARAVGYYANSSHGPPLN
jgi:hypothetical protein